MQPRQSATGTSGRPCTLGIDLGTSSAKALVVDLAGTVLAQAAAGYPVSSAQTGWAESATSNWWAAVVTCVREAVAQADVQPIAVGLSGQMHGLVVVAEGGEALRAALLWPDNRAVGYLAAYRALDADALARLANPLVPGMSGPMLMWVAEHEPEIYRQARWALQPKDWLRARLTGEVHAEPSDASASLLWDIPGERWDLDVVTRLGLDPKLLPPVLAASGTRAGSLDPSAATELGLKPGIAIAAGAGDTAAAAFGSGVNRPADAQLTIGTGAQIVRPVDHPASGAATGTHVYRTAKANGWYAMAATASAGLTLNWAREILNSSWNELYASVEAAGRADDPIFLPHLAGERTPYLDPGLRGSWSGLSLANGRQAVLRTVLEGVAFSIAAALDALPGDARPTQLRLAGGGTVAPGWQRLLANVLEVQLQAVDVTAASGRGAALLGAVAAGALSVEEIEAELAPTAHPVATPDPAAVQFYRDRRDRFDRIVAANGSPARL